VSNTRRTREARGGGFTRPKRLWHGRARGAPSRAYAQAAELNRGLFNAALGSLRTPNRSGDR
jgi:hypothetical protein